MAARSAPPFRADHVGSLLRPAGLLELRAKHARGEASAKALRAHEDECIRAAVKMQEEVGLQGVTDGEFRRATFHGDFIGQLENVEFKQIFPPGERAAGSHEAPFVAVITGKLGHPPEGIEAANFAFLRSVTRRTAKQCIPSPTMTHFRGGRHAIDAAAYPEMDMFFADLARVYREEIASLAAAGCRYLQMDDTNLAYLCDEKMRDQARARGEDVAQLPRDYARLINASIRDKPDDMSICVHMCRGNARSRWFAEGGYEPVAETIFNEMNVDGFFLEYDDERSGDFAPLRFVPKGKTIVLGLITSKRGALEDPDHIKRRIDEASRYVASEQLALSPQCGFASISEGNEINQDDQKRKLALVVEIAGQVWG